MQTVSSRREPRDPGAQATSSDRSPGGRSERWARHQRFVAHDERLAPRSFCQASHPAAAATDQQRPCDPLEDSTHAESQRQEDQDHEQDDHGRPLPEGMLTDTASCQVVTSLMTLMLVTTLLVHPVQDPLATRRATIG